MLVFFLIMDIGLQLPVLAFFLATMGVINTRMLSRYRKHALIVIMLVAAIITPVRSQHPSGEVGSVNESLCMVFISRPIFWHPPPRRRRRRQAAG